MKTSNWRESRLVLPVLAAAGGIVGGFVFGFSTDRAQGWDALFDLLPWLALLIAFNALSALTGLNSGPTAAPQDLVRPTLVFAVIMGLATAAILTIRDQGWTFSLATGFLVAVGTTGFMLLSGWLQLWVRALRD